MPNYAGSTGFRIMQDLLDPHIVIKSTVRYGNFRKSLT